MRRHEAPTSLRLPDRSDAPPSAEAGYSLIEVLAAAAILLGVLIAIMTMFVYGGQSVDAGKKMTKATSIAGDVLEEFRKIGTPQAPALIEDAVSTTANTYTWNSLTGGPQAPANATSLAILAEWKTQVEKGLPKGEMTITVRGLGALGADPALAPFTPDLTDEDAPDPARVIQVVVTVRWEERKRKRSVVFETLKS